MMTTAGLATGVGNMIEVIGEPVLGTEEDRVSPYPYLLIEFKNGDEDGFDVSLSTAGIFGTSDEEDIRTVIREIAGEL